MLEEEEKYLRAKFELLMKLGDEEDKKSCRSGVSANMKRERMEQWLTDGPQSRNTCKPVSSKSHKDPAVQAEQVSRRREEIKSVVSTSKTQSVLKNSEQITLKRLPPQTSTPVTVSHHPLNAVISPTTASYVPPRQVENVYVWPTQTSVHLPNSSDYCVINPGPGQYVSSSNQVSVFPAMEYHTKSSIYSQVPFGSVTTPENSRRADTMLTSNCNINNVPTRPTYDALDNHRSLLSSRIPAGFVSCTTPMTIPATNQFSGSGTTPKYSLEYPTTSTPNASRGPVHNNPIDIIPGCQGSHVSSLPYGQLVAPGVPWMVPTQSGPQSGLRGQQPSTMSLGPTSSQIAAR